jgi:hypothetical protein
MDKQDLQDHGGRKGELLPPVTQGHREAGSSGLIVVCRDVKMAFVHY